MRTKSSMFQLVEIENDADVNTTEHWYKDELCYEQNIWSDKPFTVKLSESIRALLQEPIYSVPEFEHVMKQPELIRNTILDYLCESAIKFKALVLGNLHWEKELCDYIKTNIQFPSQKTDRFIFKGLLFVVLSDITVTETCETNTFRIVFKTTKTHPCDVIWSFLSNEICMIREVWNNKRKGDLPDWIEWDIESNLITRLEWFSRENGPSKIFLDQMNDEKTGIKKLRIKYSKFYVENVPKSYIKIVKERTTAVDKEIIEVFKKTHDIYETIVELGGKTSIDNDIATIRHYCGDLVSESMILRTLIKSNNIIYKTIVKLGGKRNIDNDIATLQHYRGDLVPESMILQ